MPFGLYIHFPFCHSAEAYCGLYSKPYDSDREELYYKALTIETSLAAAGNAPHDREISSIFIGGGTPSLTNLDLFSNWLQYLRRHFHVPKNIEFTVTFSPESATLGNLTIFRQLGVNRPVFRIGSFNSRLLRMLNRNDSPHHSHRAIYWANALGYTNFSVDLVFGFPRQTSRMLSADLDQLLDLEPPHISFYRLTVEAGTKLAVEMADGLAKMPSPELAMAMYRGGCEQLAEVGYRRYEISSFARPGCECRYNLGYWEGRDYLGLGPSAHSLMNGKRSINTSSFSAYVERLKGGKLPRVVDENTRRLVE